MAFKEEIEGGFKNLKIDDVMCDGSHIGSNELISPHGVPLSPRVEHNSCYKFRTT